MKKGAILILLVHYCALLVSQNLTLTRQFDTYRKNVPLQIINNDAGYFYMLRYNKLAHDMTVERRSKSSGQVLAFTPLRLDSVNANWFDYEHLDYLFFEHNHICYFVFEKMLNTSKSIFMKAIDTMGHSNGFVELGSLDLDKMAESFNFSVTRNGGKLLVVSALHYINKSSKKVALLYDAEARRNIWVKKLPLENAHTGYSRCYTADAQNNLYYLITKEYVSGYKRKVINQQQVMVPVFACDSLIIATLLHDDPLPHRAPLAVSKLNSLKSIYIDTEKEPVVVAHYTQNNAQGQSQPFLLAQGFSPDLGRHLFSEIAPLNASLTEKLTFYDGDDLDEPAGKDYTLSGINRNNGYLYYMAGRSEPNYFKELLLWKINLRNGHVLDQQLLPRKIFYFDDRTRFKNLGLTAQQSVDDNLYTFVIEHPNNLAQAPQDFKFRRFSKQKYLSRANLVAYILRPNGAFEKKLVYRNKLMEAVPLQYTSNQRDAVFYLNNAKTEQFAILKLGDL